jgi:iron complex transport system ATP-binding protein
MRGVAFAVEREDILCILGPNGSGKTTLLRALLGAHRPDAGTVRLAGAEVSRLPPWMLASRLAYVPQAVTNAVPFSVLDVVLMGRTSRLKLFATPSARDRRLALEALARTGIEHLRERRFTEISGGERQLALIARAIAQQAEVLVLDEPTASLDFGNQIRILRMLLGLAADGYAIVMAMHFPDQALLMRSRVAILNHGQLVAMGEAASVISSQLLSTVYGTPIRVVDLPPGESAGGQTTVCVPIIDRLQPKRVLS